MARVQVVLIVVLTCLLGVQTVRLGNLQREVRSKAVSSTDSDAVRNEHTSGEGLGPEASGRSGEAKAEAIVPQPGLPGRTVAVNDIEATLDSGPSPIVVVSGTPVPAAGGGVNTPGTATERRRQSDRLDEGDRPSSEGSGRGGRRGNRSAREEARLLRREAVTSAMAGDYENAIALLEESLDENPKDKDTHSVRAQLFRMMGMEEDELQAYLDWAEAMPEASAPRFHLARLYERRGFDQEALDAVGEFEEVNGSDPGGRGRAAMLYRQLGLREEEGVVLQEWTEEAPDSVHARMALAEYYRAMGDLEGAIEEYRAVVELVPDNAQVSLRMARVYQNMESYDEAQAEFLVALDLRPHDPYIRIQVADFYRRRGALETSAGYYQTVVEARPNTPLAERAQRQLDGVVRRMARAQP